MTTKEVLERIHYTYENGLVEVTENPTTECIAEWYHIEYRAKKIGANYVLFRRFYNEENVETDAKPYNAVPTVYVFELDGNGLINGETQEELHKKIWSANEIDVYMIVGKTTIDVFNARNTPDIAKALDTLKLCSEALDKFNDARFSVYAFGKGTFWESSGFEMKKDRTPFHILLNHLEATRRNIAKKFKNELQIIDKLLLVSILIKFLEDKKDSQGNFALKKKYEEYKAKYGVNSFKDILLYKGNGKLCIQFLQELANKYNGQIFDILTENKAFVENTDLSDIALFVEGFVNPDNKQVSIWQEYAFDYLPTELISVIYESFLNTEVEKNKNGAVYTPSFLVNFLIDEVMPLNLPKENYLKNGKIDYKVLDPSCGSGIFLVSAYKRLLDWWWINHYANIPTNPKELSDILQDILENNIYGVDINKTATQISIFSLTLTFLDRIDPKLFWGDFELKSLSKKNVTDKDFFDWNPVNGVAIDLAIGNPPFIKNKEAVKKSGFSHLPIPQNNLAFCFFEKVMNICNESAIILPTKNLLYSKDSQSYRQHIFTKYNINKFFDFTNLRRSLFGSAEVEVSIIKANNKKNSTNYIEHIVIKRVITSEFETRFEIDHYDRHLVNTEWAKDEKKQFIWKTNLLGGVRLFHFVNKLKIFEKLIDYIKGKKWIYSKGYAVNDIYQKGKEKPADYITGKLTISPKSFDKFGGFDTIEEKNILFAAPRSRGLYEPPHIIFKSVVEDDTIPVAFVDEYLCFNSSFVGVSAPKEDREQLYEVYNRLHKSPITTKVYQTFILATSSKALVYRGDAITKEDIDNLPYPENIDSLLPTKFEQMLIDDVLKYYRHFQKSIDGDGKVLYEKVTFSQLESYGNAFCELINPLHEEDGMIWEIGEVYTTEDNNFIAYQFQYGKPQNKPFELKKATLEGLDKDVFPNMIFNTQENRGATFVRVLRVYGETDTHEYVLFVKPNATRYWLNSIALRDADDVFCDYFREGY
jgi:hypothetical protein